MVDGPRGKGLSITYMKLQKKILAVIPARAGSKGITKKNIVNLQNVPLIAYSIEAAKRSNLVTRIICSTDSQEIANIAVKYGAEVPFLRPKEISKDNSTDLDAFKHVINWLHENESYNPDLILQLRPTSPLRTVQMIDDSISIMIKERSYDSLRSISQSIHTPYKMWKLLDDKNMEQLLQLIDNREPYNSARQILPKTYTQTGSIDITRPNTIRQFKSMTGNKIYPFLIEPKYFIDIDDNESLELTALRLKNIDCVKF